MMWSSEISTQSRWIAGLLWVVLLVFSGWFASTPLGQSAERSVDNWHWRMGAVVQPDSRFVLVDIDERSLAIEGSWPWSRFRIAELIEALQDSGASEITLDMMFPDTKADDMALAEQLLLSPQPVVAMTFALPGNDTVLSGVLPDSVKVDLCRLGLFPEAIGYIGHSEILDVRVGHIVPRVESDGVLRETPAFVCFDGQAYPALSLQAFLHASGLGQSIVVSDGNQTELVIDDAVRIPLTAQGGIRIPYHLESPSFERVSASDVLAGIVELDGRWAVVGSSAVGLSDRISTPLVPLETGALAHVRLLGAMLDQKFPVATLGGQVMIWVATALLLGGLFDLEFAQTITLVDRASRCCDIGQLVVRYCGSFSGQSFFIGWTGGTTDWTSQWRRGGDGTRIFPTSLRSTCVGWPAVSLLACRCSRSNRSWSGTWCSRYAHSIRYFDEP